MRVAASVLIASLLAVAAVARPAARWQAPVPPLQSDTPQNYLFPSGAGMLFFYVKPEKTSAFETVVTRLADVLDRTEDPVRKQQAANWRILKSVHTTKDSAVYVFVFDPAVAGADYDPIKLLGEKLPEDIRALYETLRESTIRVERMGLTKLR